MAQKILLIRLSALGDVIFALPALEALKRRYPGARISWVVEDKASSLLLHRDDLKSLIIYPRKEIQRSLYHPLRWPSLLSILFKHLMHLRKEQYDLVFDFQGNLKSGFHMLLARGKRKVGFARGHVKELNHLFSKERIRPLPEVIHRIEKNLSLLEPDPRQWEIVRPNLMIPQDLLERAEEEIRPLFKEKEKILVVHPGTSAFGAFKRWAPQKFGALARRLRDEWGYGTLVTWGPGEEHLAREAADTGGEGVVMAPRSTSLMHLAAFIRMGALYVGADSGPLHLANYQGVPCLGLFGPKDPALYKPYFSPSAVVRSGVDCSPCTLRQCPDPICMKELEVDQVYDVLLTLLKEKG